MAQYIEQPPTQGGGSGSISTTTEEVRYFVGANRQVSVSSDSSATTTVYYASVGDAQADARGQRTITWTAWPRGTVSASTTVTDITRQPLALRIVASGGTATVSIQDPAPYSWASADHETNEALTNVTASGTLAVTGATTLGTLAATDTITVTDGKNIVLGTGTGTQVGTATTQKLGFFGKTPIVQPANQTDIMTDLVNLGLLSSGAQFSLTVSRGISAGGGALVVDSSGNVGLFGATPVAQQAYVANTTTNTTTLMNTVNSILTALRNVGIQASS